MKKLIPSIAFLLPLMALLSGCEFIGGVFKAGVNVGVFLVLIVIALLVFLVIKMKKS